MRRRSFRRFGALSLTLLLQVFVLSGFIHPCCLGGGDVSGPSHQAHEATPVDQHAGLDHQVLPVDDHSSDRLGAEVAHGEGHAPVMSHAGPSEEHGCGDCGQGCDFCCQVAGEAVLPAAVAPHPPVPTPVERARHERAERGELPSTAAFLLPFANGPPSEA